MSVAQMITKYSNSLSRYSSDYPQDLSAINVWPLSNVFDEFWLVTMLRVWRQLE